MALKLEGAPAAEARIDPRELAQEIDAAALNQAAEDRERISAIGDIARERVQELIAMGQIDEDVAPDIQAALNTLQSQRMAEIQGDATVRVERMGERAAAYFDGTDIVHDVDHIEVGVYRHELQHRKDGLPHDLDKHLAPKTGVRVIDERVENAGTKRDRLEERAMDAAGEIPAAYKETHWKTVKELEQRGKEVGIDMEHADSRLITTEGEDAYSAALVELSVREIAEEDPEELIKLQEEAERTGADADILRVIAETRDGYEHGRREVPKPVPTTAI